MNRAAAGICWLLQIAAAAIFLFAGSKKLMADPQMVAVFAKVGIGQWFRLLTGILEVGGGIALLVPRTAAFAAILRSYTRISGCAPPDHAAPHMKRGTGRMGAGMGKLLALVMTLFIAAIIGFGAQRTPLRSMH